MRVGKGLLGWGLILVLPGASGARGEEVKFTLAEALSLASTANPELQAAAARVEVQVARTESARRLRWPRLSLSLGWSRLDLPAGVFANKLNSGQFVEPDFEIARLNDPGAVSHLGSTLSLDVPIDVFGRVGTMAVGMGASGDAAAASTRDAAQEIRLRVSEAYRRAELAARAVEVTERSLDVARAREDEIEARVDAGSALRADLLRARARRREREADLAERRSQREMALAGLARLVGAEPGTTYVPSEGPPPVAPLDGEEAEWIERGLRQRPALEAARHKVEAAGALVRGEEKARWPEIGAFGQLYDNRLRLSEGSQAWAVGIGVKWSPLDGPRAQRQAAAMAEERAAKLDARAVRDQVRLEVRLAYRRAIAARDRHAAAAGGAEEGREAVRVVSERRLAGLATLTDELETETAALWAELQEIGAATEVALADAALGRAAGEI